MFRCGKGSSPAKAPAPCLERPPNNANSTFSSSCRRTKAPIRSGGACPVTNRTGFIWAESLLIDLNCKAALAKNGSSQRVRVGGERLLTAALPGEAGGNGRARALGGLAQPVGVGEELVDALAEPLDVAGGHEHEAVAGGSD